MIRFFRKRANTDKGMGIAQEAVPQDPTVGLVDVHVPRELLTECGVLEAPNGLLVGERFGDPVVIPHSAGRWRVACYVSEELMEDAQGNPYRDQIVLVRDDLDLEARRSVERYVGETAIEGATIAVGDAAIPEAVRAAGDDNFWWCLDGCEGLVTIAYDQDGELVDDTEGQGNCIQVILDGDGEAQVFTAGSPERTEVILVLM